MYCSSCGVAVPPGLSYCNHCGEKLSSGKSDSIIKSPEVRPETLIGAMVCSFVFGLVAITVLMGVMKASLHVENGIILGFTLLGLLIMLLLESVFIRLLFRRRHGSEEAGGTVLSKGQATRELDAAQARMLQESMPSVTEHTTRAFDPIYRKRTSK